MLRKGSKVRIISDNENYQRYFGKVLKITHIAKSREDHPGYDDTMQGMALYDLETLEGESIGFSLYEYEIERA